jgi:hypothetical protein
VRPQWSIEFLRAIVPAENVPTPSIMHVSESISIR